MWNATSTMYTQLAFLSHQFSTPQLHFSCRVHRQPCLSVSILLLRVIHSDNIILVQDGGSIYSPDTAGTAAAQHALVLRQQ
jgi:hypothetical protein